MVGGRHRFKSPKHKGGTKGKDQGGERVTLPNSSSWVEALGTLNPPPNAKMIGGNKRGHNDIDNEIWQVDEIQSCPDEWVRKGGKGIGVVEGDHDARGHVVVASFRPPNVPYHFPTFYTPHLLRVGRVRDDILNHTHNDGHKPLFFDIL